MKDEHFLLLFKTTTLLAYSVGDAVQEKFLPALEICQESYDDGNRELATNILTELSSKLIELLEA